MARSAAPITVTPIGLEDRAEVHRLIQMAYAEFEPRVAPQHWRTMMTNLARVVDGAGPEELLVAAAAGRPVGTVTFYPPGPREYDRVPLDWAVIRALAVDPGWRGRGVGTALTDECLRLAGAAGARIVGLHTAELMAAAVRIYQRAGFRHERDFVHLGMRFQVFARTAEVAARTDSLT
jgi:ribosomal protein S18 acetylase RimI-like enzyme